MNGREGATALVVDAHASKGPKSASAVFYNPAMSLDRDLCILFTRYAYAQGCRTFLDGLGATGIRAIRIRQDLPDNAHITVNEKNPISVSAINKQAALNNVTLEILNEDVRTLLHQRRFDYIDIDPYGSPATYAHATLAAAKRTGYVAITATDKATLCGVHPKACRRRYDAINRRGEAMKEIGLRILIGFFVRIAAIYDLAAIPVFSYSYDHYFRAYLQLREGAHRADAALGQIGWAGWHNGWQIAEITQPFPDTMLGPLWLGPLLDAKIVNSMMQQAPDAPLDRPRAVHLLLSTLHNETDAPPLYYESSRRCKHLRIPQPSMRAVQDVLHTIGFPAIRTHFDPSGLKTNASLAVIEQAFQQITAD